MKLLVLGIDGKLLSHPQTFESTLECIKVHLEYQFDLSDQSDLEGESLRGFHRTKLRRSLLQELGVTDRYITRHETKSLLSLLILDG